MTMPYTIFLVFLVAILIAVYKHRKLTLVGTLTGGLVELSIYIGAGLPGILMLAAFFVMATIATSWKKASKGQTHPEIRDAAQVLANGGMAALCGLVMWLMPACGYLLLVLLAAALSSATADTLSSELGTVYGRRFYNIISFKPDERGRDGVISLEGTLVGIAGSMVIALIYALFSGWSKEFWFIVISGTAGNILDSVLGATLERGGYIKNNLVNFLNTVCAALVAYLLLLI
ncbi:DUF92 domain-containing protein [Mucilaginibacter gilvus]|uniref:DUF92 domain-containing protein n=1 Tax=Mucilaginibacter gilvus TaxID=2305909 RepID=A0A444MM84_9SPHI|nr:DUF92 domain-containing protein [Mucilaginibacter gilvus]RWY50417.1 DUF92 domain-containing protein [Mucilaginibacter gilvus]